MKIAFEALLVALVTVTCLTPAARWVALRLGAVSHPGGRHVHRRSIPRLGGLAICGGFLAAVVGLFLIDPAAAALFGAVPRRAVGLVAGGVAMCLIGVVDDTRGIRALHKLLLQITVAVFAYGCGFRILGVHVPLLGDIDTSAAALPLTVLWIVGIINAVNLIDGLDGLAAGVVFFAAVTNFVVAWISGLFLVALLAGAIAGSVLGFLFYNWSPARIFMGDSGSYFLGYVLSTTALITTTQKASTAVSLVVPILALGVPIFDTLFAMVRRILERRSVFSPDRGHIHHRLLDMGLTHRRAVIILYAASGLFTAAAIGVSLGRTWQVGVALFVASATLIGLVRFVGYYDYLVRSVWQRMRIRPRDAELLRRVVPRLPQRFDEARTEAEVMNELWRFGDEAELDFVELLAEGDKPVAAWQRRASVAPGSARATVTATYPLGRDDVAHAWVRFGWSSDFGDVPPQCEILLQVAADILTSNLTRVKSSLAPASYGEPALADAPAPIAVHMRESQV